MNYYKDRIVEFPKDKKELLDLKISREIKELSKNNFPLLSLAQDFASIINYGNFNSQELVKMINYNNLIKELVTTWQDSEEVMELQENLLKSFLSH